MASVQSRFRNPHFLADVLKACQGQAPHRTPELHEAVNSEIGHLTTKHHPQVGDTGSIGGVDQEDNRPVVLVTNDDDIQSRGLRALVEALVGGGYCNVYVCVPDSKKSGVGHSITTQETLAVHSVGMEGVSAYEVSGTPADCVSLSLSGVLFPWKKPSLVLSGINKGSNCGNHIFYSGTIGGAREAFICGLPAIAISLDWKKGESNEGDFKVAAEVCLPLIHAALRDIAKGVFPKGCFFKVDIPLNPSKHKGFKVTRQGTPQFVAKWHIVTPQSCISGDALCKGHAIGSRLAQLGLAASAVGAARRMNSPLKNTEIESVAGPENGSQSFGLKKKQYYKKEVAEIEAGDMDSDHDLRALQEGYVTVTPLGLVTHLETESSSRVAYWIASFESAAPSTLVAGASE